MNILTSHLRIKNGYVYGLASEDGSVIKVGKAKNKSQLSARISAQKKLFVFNLVNSFCFRFENEFRAHDAEQSMLSALRHWKVVFTHPFPGHTEYLDGKSRNDIFKWMLNMKPRGFISMEHILDELKRKESMKPVVNVHAKATATVTHSGHTSPD